MSLAQAHTANRWQSYKSTKTTCAASLLQWYTETLISLWAQPFLLGTQLDPRFNKQTISPFHSIACSARQSLHLCGRERSIKRCVGVKSVGLWVSPAPCHWVTTPYKAAQHNHWEGGQHCQPTGSLVQWHYTRVSDEATWKAWRKMGMFHR